MDEVKAGQFVYFVRLDSKIRISTAIVFKTGEKDIYAGELVLLPKEEYGESVFGTRQEAEDFIKEITQGGSEE